MAGTAASYKDGGGATRNRSVTTAGGLDIARMIPVSEADAPLDLATQTTLAAILAKIIASPASETTLASILAKLNSATSVSDAARLPVSQLDGLAVSGSATSATTLFTQDMLGYESITVQVTSAGSSTIVYETSDDNTNWVTTAGLTSASIGSLPLQINSTDARLIQFARRGRYFRARISAYTSGTISVVGTLSKSPVFNVGASFVSPVITNGSSLSGNNFPSIIAGYSANPVAVATGTHVRPIATLIGAAIQKPFSIPEADWSYATASGGETGTTDIPVKAAAGAGLRNYMTWLTAENVHATVDTDRQGRRYGGLSRVPEGAWRRAVAHQFPIALEEHRGDRA